MLFEHQISIFKWFLKDHVTLKTGVIAAKKFTFAIIGINYLLKCIQIENSYFKLQYKTCFYCIYVIK